MLPTPYDEEIELLLEQELGAKTNIGGLAAFMKQISPELQTPKHLQPLISALERAMSEPIQLCLSMPPQHGKSLTIKHALAYALTKVPDRTHAYATYADRLTKTQARHIRRLALKAGVKPVPGAKALDHWETVDGGGVVATSISGSLTGNKVNGIMVIDDPFKDRADAESAVQREKVWEFFTQVAGTRRHKTTSQVIVHTRWHPDDLIGRIMKERGDDWEYINLPAIDEDNKALWPEMHDLKFLEGQRLMGEYAFEALYQGRPKPKGATIFQEPARYVYPKDDKALAEFLEGKYLIIAVDPATTAKTSADFSVIGLMAKNRLGPVGKAWIMDIQRQQVTTPKLVDLIYHTWERWKCRIAVEAVGGFKAVPQYLEEVSAGRLVRGKQLWEIHPTCDKFLRAQPISAAWNDGRVLVPYDAPWVEPFLDEVLAFSGIGDRHDDQVDAIAHGWNTLSQFRERFRGSIPHQSTFG